MEKIHKIVLLLFILFTFGTFLIPGPRIATDFPYAYPESFSSKQIELPQTWRNFGTDGLGYPLIDGLWSWPMDIFVVALGKIGLPFWLITRLFFIVPIILFSVFGMTKLLSYYENSSAGQLVGTVFFLTNSYILLLIDGGQLNLAVAYSLLPLAFYFFIKERLISFVIIFMLISIFDIRFIFLLSILLAFWLVFNIKKLKIFVKFTLLTGAIFLTWHSYWIIPRIITHQSGLPEAYTQISQLNFLNFTTLGHALSFLQPHWPKNIFGQITPLRPEFLLLPFLAFLPIFLKIKKHTVYFWSFTAIVFIFLSKGNQPPLSEIYSWLFIHIPGFFLFRDSTKFFSLQAISYSILIAAAVTYLSKHFKYFWLFPILVLLIPIFYFTTRDATGLFSLPRMQNQYRELSRVLSQDSEYGQIVWVPYFPGLGYSSLTHPTLDASVLSQKRSFAIGTVGIYETHNFIREAAYMGNLFKILGIKYLVYTPPDLRRDPVKPDNLDYYTNFLNQLSHLSWLKKVDSSSIPLFQISNSQSLFFIPSQTTFVVGPDDLYKTQKDLSQNALIFVEEKPGISQNITKIPGAKIYLNHKNRIDFAASFISPDKFIFPANTLKPNPDESGWWKRDTEDFLKWRNFLQQKYQIDNTDFDYSGGWAVAEGSKSLPLKSDNLKSGQVLLARVMSSHRGGKISFTQEKNLIGEINTFLPEAEKTTIKLTGNDKIPDQFFTYSRSEVAWHEIGALTDSSDIEISTSGDLNVINVLAAVSTEDWIRLQTQAANLVGKSKNIEIYSQPKAETLKTFSSTHYRVKVTGVTQPTVLAFAQSYNPDWTANGTPPLPLYSLINGFPIEKDGEYDIYYQPQKYILPSLSISAITLAVFLIFSAL